MKGIIDLKVQIDYESMLSGSKADAIGGFAGTSDREELANLHLKSIASEMTSGLRDKPYIKYDIKGSIIPKEEIADQVKKSQGDSSLPETGEDNILNNDMDLEKLRSLHDHNKLINNSPIDPVAKLNETLSEISKDKGIPVVIRMNDEMIGLLKDLEMKEITTKNSIIETYNGFKVELEGMEELFMVDFKDYHDNEIKSYGLSGTF
ncbi:hypothetical protein MF621_004063 (plasmid) [Bacillus velezensis]|uniref:hypothetical protein n=1 Tax=Bacillus velezensis TaxID=492670 RepID=UPI00049FF0E9|nr:hypothetical protein [Bacillus velezensis]KDN91169.1 hypothetical protein EF87_20360 [Bacillus amyloliquefaciens]URJ76357.1 hypothetical protein MF619_004101 [Bacillus velezensis]URJ80477.1 hypothetical protein MF621_004063 [Bacillus velezensis]